MDKTLTEAIMQLNTVYQFNKCHFANRKCYSFIEDERYSDKLWLLPFHVIGILCCGQLNFWHIVHFILYGTVNGVKYINLRRQKL